MAGKTGGAGGGAAPKADPLAKLQEMIDSSIERAFASRDSQQAEQSDPWKRLEGVVDRSVSKHFEAFMKGLEEGMANEAPEGGAGGKGGREADEGDGKILGGLFG